MSVRGWTLGIDWSRQGVYSNPYEDATSAAEGGDTQIVVSYGQELEGSTAQITTGEMGITLNNLAREYSPENAASPLAGKVELGTPVSLTYDFNGYTYLLALGVIADINVDTNSPANTFTASVQDSWGAPGAEILSTPIYQGIRTGDAVNIILDAIGWTGPRQIDAGVTYIAYWWEEGTDAATAVQKLVDSEGPPATAFVRAGTFYFHDRHHRLLTAASQTSQGTFSVSGGTGAKILQNTFDYNHGLNRIINYVSFEIDQRKTLDIQMIWESTETIVLGANEVQRIEIVPSSPFVNAQPLRLPDDVDLVVGGLNATLTRLSGESTTLILQAGSGGAILSGIRLRASPIVVARTVKVIETDDGSIGRRGKRSYPGKVPWANAYDADVIANKLVSMYANNRPVISFTVRNVDDTTTTQQVQRSVGDRVTIRNDYLGINGPYIIEKIQHSVKLWKDFETTFFCQPIEPTQPSNVFLFDVSGQGFDQGSFGVNSIDNPAQMFRFDVTGNGFDQGKLAS